MIARGVIDSYTRKLNGLSASARRIVAQSLANIEFDSVADLRGKLIEILEPIYGVSTDMAAAYAADFYDEIRELSVGERLGATADSGRKPEVTEGFIRAFVGGVASKGIVESLSLFTDRADYEIKRAAGDCVYLNGEVDPLEVRFARVPSGFETCPFCIMLASRGFVYRNKTTAGADGHYHPHCDCRIVPSFSKDEIEGYDPDALYRQWRDSDFKPKTKQRERESGWKADPKDGLRGFKNFNEVKSYLYGADTFSELEERYGVLEKVYGREKMQSLSLTNMLKTANKVLKKEAAYDD